MLALKRMLLIRRFDELALELLWSGRLEGVVHPYVGQEACAVGVCSALQPGDRVMSSHRGHGHCIAAGIDVRPLMAELFGRVTGCCRGKGGSMHIADFEAGMLGANGIVGAGVPIAAGAALSDAMHGSDRVTVAFFGDGATGQGVLYETMNITALWRLPILFVCENNGIVSGNELADVLAAGSVAGLAEAHGLSASVVEGHDVDMVHAATVRAVEAIRAGHGPHLIECLVNRWCMHASRRVPMADLRDPARLAEARTHDAIDALSRRLIDSGALDSRGFAALSNAVERELAQAIEYAESSPYPDDAEAFEHVFA